LTSAIPPPLRRHERRA